MRIAALMLILPVLMFPCGAVQIVEFCPDTYQNGEQDEYFVLEGKGSLDGFRVSDGEGSARFPEHSQIAGRIVVARTGTTFFQVHGYPPDFELYDTVPAIPDMIRGGDLRMSNERDELVLMSGITEIQRISWPGDVVSRQGQVHFLEDGTWDPRPLLIGQSRFSPEYFENVTVTVFVSPDCARDVMTRAIETASDYIYVNVYEFTDPFVAEELIHAAGRGVEIAVLLEGGPVGGISPEEMGIVAELQEHGIPCSIMTTTDAAHAKYRFNHAKYLIIDGDGILLTTENFKPSGFPEPGTAGNRGWGVYLEDDDLTRYFEAVYDWDSTGGDIVPLVAVGTVDPETGYDGYQVEFTSRQFFTARVAPVLAPDTSYMIVDLIDSAKQSIDIEQAYISNWSGERLNPYLSAAINASRRGVSVRVLLDSSWFNIDDASDNDEMAAFINQIAQKEQLPLSARCANLEGNNLEKIHTKGVIVDQERVLISSINWNEHSPSFNREAGVIIDHPGVGAYFREVFEDDWNAGSPEDGNAIDLQKCAAAGVTILLLILLFLRRRR